MFDTLMLFLRLERGDFDFGTRDREMEPTFAHLLGLATDEAAKIPAYVLVIMVWLQIYRPEPAVKSARQTEAAQ